MVESLLVTKVADTNSNIAWLTSSAAKMSAVQK
jgi:hypothetical protein